MKINAKTFAGVGLGLVAGYFLFKTKDKKFLYIGSMGLAGGLLANFISNRNESKKPVTISTKDYVKSANEELMDKTTDNVELPIVPVMSAELKETSPKDYFDIDLGVPNN